MELVDTHCHIQSVGAEGGETFTRALWNKADDHDPAAVIARAEAAGVTRMICVGCTLEDSQLATDFVVERDMCWASVGIHPHEAGKYAGDDAARAEFAQLPARPKVVAIGECGLDYFYEHSDKQSQRAILAFQLELALQHNLPVIFHVRDAFDDFWPVFEQYHSAERPIRGVLHSFTDMPANLAKALDYGLHVGVNGIATFTKQPEQLDVYRRIPLDSLLLETDAPFLTPVPDRGKICEPYHVRTTLEFLAGLRREPVETIAAATTGNARSLLGI